MSRIVLPQGQSIRQIAARLGVSVDELRKYTGVQDTEAPLAVARSVDVPDGFLKSRAKGEELTDAIVAKSAKRGGMNMWLALDIEQKRTRAAGGMHAHVAQDDELLALAEARTAYLRYEAESNTLAAALYAQASITPSITVRAGAFAGQAQALAMRALLFGEPASRVKGQALSAAKAALLADPKLAEAHLAMALALSIAAEPAERAEALAAALEATRLDARSPFVWAEQGLLLGEGDAQVARVALANSHATGVVSVRALELAGRLALLDHDLAAAAAHLEAACVHTPTYLRPKALLGHVMLRAGRDADAAATLAAVLQESKVDDERQVLRAVYEQGR